MPCLSALHSLLLQKDLMTDDITHYTKMKNMTFLLAVLGDWAGLRVRPTATGTPRQRARIDRRRAKLPGILDSVDLGRTTDDGRRRVANRTTDRRDCRVGGRRG